MDKNELADVEQDDVENRIIWNGTMKDCYIWDMIPASQGLDTRQVVKRIRLG